MKIRFALLAAAAALLIPLAPARAEDLRAVARDIYKLVFENERLRVYELNFKPHAKVPMHREPNHLMYMLSDGTLVFSEEGKRPFEMMFKAGEAVWVPAQTRAAENDSEEPIRAVVVELKDGGALAERPAVAGKAKARAKGRGHGKAHFRGKRRR